MIILLLIAIGLIAGICSGLFGVGGGLIIVPALIFFVRLPAHVSMAISIVALLLPVGGLAAWEYYSAGRLSTQYIIYGVVIGISLFFGAYFGAKLSLSLDEVILKKAFAIFLLFAAALVWFKA